jgi:hypothetical protein
MFAVGELGLPLWGKGDHEVVDEVPNKILFFERKRENPPNLLKKCMAE